MSNFITEEYNESLKFHLEEINFNASTSLVALTRKNVALVEMIIKYDSAYSKASDTNAAPNHNKNYCGSTAFWMSLLKKYFNREQIDYDYSEIIQNAVIAIDRENSTHINADVIKDNNNSGGRYELAERISNIDPKNLINYLKYPEETNYELIEIISTPTEKGNFKRTNLSFASKFCHYACFYLFEGEKEQDNYPIYDQIVKNHIPNYMKYYEIEKKNLKDYKEYKSAIDEIILKSGYQISRNGFDHLIWYYYKNKK